MCSSDLVGGIESGGKWDYSLDGGQTWTPGTGSSISGSALSEGTNQVTVRQTDAAGNQSTATADVVKDTQVVQPTIGTSTGTGAINNSGSVSVAGIESGAKWDYSLDGGQTWTQGSGSSISGSALNEGTNQVTVRQTDLAGNVGISSSLTIERDTQINEPVVTGSNGNSAYLGKGASISVSGLESGATWEWRTHVDGRFSEWTKGSGDKIDVDQLPQNTAMGVFVRTTDLAGNQAQNYTFAYVDIVPPTVSLQQPSATDQAQIYSSEQVRYYLVRSDQEIDVSQGPRAISKLDASLWKVATIYNAGYATVDASGLADGSYRLYAVDTSNLVQVSVGEGSSKVQAVLQVVNGQALTNMVTGTQGDDVLQAPANGGLLMGKGGADVFAFQGSSGQAGKYVIVDYNESEGDVIDLSALFPNYDSLAWSNYLRVDSGVGHEQVLKVDIEGTGDFTSPELEIFFANNAVLQHHEIRLSPIISVTI